MKSIIRKSAILILLCLPVAIVSGQDKVTEKKIKIVVEDEKGNKTIIDTTFTETPGSNAITLKDGKAVFIGDGEDMEWESADGKQRIIVSISKSVGSDDKKVIVQVPSDRNKYYDNNTNSTKMVVAKDGMVITIEGEDETKVRDLMQLIESNLGLDPKGPKGRK